MALDLLKCEKSLIQEGNNMVNFDMNKLHICVSIIASVFICFRTIKLYLTAPIVTGCNGHHTIAHEL